MGHSQKITQPCDLSKPDGISMTSYWGCGSSWNVIVLVIFFERRESWYFTMNVHGKGWMIIGIFCWYYIISYNIISSGMITNIVLTINNDTNLGMFWFITQFLKPGLAHPILCILKQWEQPINSGKWSDQGNQGIWNRTEWERTGGDVQNAIE